MEYHGCNCCSDARAFSLELATQKEETPLGATLELFTRIRYLNRLLFPGYKDISECQTVSFYTNQWTHNPLDLSCTCCEKKLVQLSHGYSTIIFAAMNGLWNEARLLRNCYPFFRYLKGKSSNMAIVDVEIPTGYIYTGFRLLDEFVSHQERY